MRLIQATEPCSLPRAAAGAHSERDNTAMENGEQSMLVSQRDSRPVPQGIQYNQP